MKTRICVSKKPSRDFPGGSVVKNHPSNARDRGSIPGQGTKILHATRQLSLRAILEKKPVPHNEDPAQPKLKKNKDFRIRVFLIRCSSLDSFALHDFIKYNLFHAGNHSLVFGPSAWSRLWYNF